MNFVPSSNGDVVTFGYSPNNQITFSESVTEVAALTATFVYQGATLVDSVFGAIPANWKQGNTSITQLTLGTSVTTIGTRAFSGCSNLSGSLTIPNNVTSISSYAFSYCNNLGATLTIGSGVTSIGSYAFYICTRLTTVLCYVTKTIVDATNCFLVTSIRTIRVRATDGTWTAGAGQTIAGQSGITVIKDL
jgi:hypothetical protein